jgi:hypothetical protein
MKSEQSDEPGSEPSVEELREHMREAVARTTLREVARQTSVGPETLRKFIHQETLPRGSTLDRLQRWFVRDSALAPYGTPLASRGTYTPSSPRPYSTARQRARTAAAQSSPEAERVAMRLQSARRAFETDADLADLLGVDRAQPARWRAGQAPDPANREKIVALDIVVELLSGYLSPSSIPKWLNGTNAHLGNRRPIALLREGNLSEVIAAIESEKSGAFA